MSYNDRESSNYDGEPIYLYEFRLNDQYWRYTSAATRMSLGGQVWEPMGVSDDGIKQTGDTSVDALNITMPISSPVVGLFIGTPPISPIYITLRRFHMGDDDAAVCYVGEVMESNQNSPVSAVLTCNTLSASLERNGLRLSYTRGCPYSLYDVCCKVDKEQFRYNGTISTVGGSQITVPGIETFGDRWFAGGYIEWVDPKRGVDRRAIEQHTGNKLTIFGTVSGLAGGMIIKIYPGCPRTTQACKTKFNNLANYGGIPSMPDRSPFDGNPIFN
ncbi:tail assembly protein [Cronobacter phage JC01]|uniref:Tail assembly protein n=1 Tax=Cronobacter phage JC01 TaxID=2729575 RepID=A0A6M3YKF5_9CAUD|nr:tail assembly protein [Cronobacter phage JC01]QJI52244.1 tail assembly protein [Cronobacter phage JC01]